MLSACLALATTLLFAPPVPKPYAWHDEMDTPSLWAPLGSQNDPVPSTEVPGILTLTMPQVPIGYPHNYQWGAVTRTVAIDTEKTPWLVAGVPRLSDGGYAHLDIEMRDYEGKVIKGARSNRLQGRGLASVNLKSEFGAGLLRLTVRLIVGGPNSGAFCDYDFVRAVRPEQLTTLQNTLFKPAPPARKPAARGRYGSVL